METQLHNLFGKVMHQLLLVVHSPPPSLLQGTKKLCPPLKVARKLLGICQDDLNKSNINREGGSEDESVRQLFSSLLYSM